MNLISKTLAAFSLLLAFSSCSAQIKNATTESVKVHGNCRLCETTIENAGSLKKVAQVEWNEDTKMATLIYDTSKTSQAEILKRIALAGYDSDLFLAPDDAYAKLPECCQYDRVSKSTKLQNEEVKTHSMQNHPTAVEKEQEANELKAIIETYYSLKDALVQSDQKSASSIATEFHTVVDKVNMNKLSTEEHTVWMKVRSSLKENIDVISTSTNIEKQRNAFMNLSESIYDLTKVTKLEEPIYYQHCPMYNDGKGANWLSKENAIKNPYYGGQMLTCGNTVEIIK